MPLLEKAQRRLNQPCEAALILRALLSGSDGKLVACFNLLLEAQVVFIPPGLVFSPLQSNVAKTFRPHKIVC